MNRFRLISYHGGHSGEFCCHARDSLEEIIRQYIRLGFTTVGITEHIPPSEDRFRYPDEIEKGLKASDLQHRFGVYFQTARRLKRQYRDQIHIFIGMETEAWTGYIPYVRHLISTHRPDYIVGSIHHLNNICFDFSKEDYDALALTFGSLEAMYSAYFDCQYDMIRELKPFIVGHFDLIRIYDAQFEERLLVPEIKEKILRNLEAIRDAGLVLDFNLRPLAKGEKSPYIAPWILKAAARMGIPAIPGDDAHSAAQAGGYVENAIHTLMQYGFNTDWPEPVLKE